MAAVIGDGGLIADACWQCMSQQTAAGMCPPSHLSHDTSHCPENSSIAFATRIPSQVSVQRFSKPDLFVEVSVGGSYGKTTQKDGKENPDFNETLLLWPRQPDGGVVAQGPPVLTVRVFDDDVVGHDAVGVGTLTLQDGWETAPPADTQVWPCTSPLVAAGVDIAFSVAEERYIAGFCTWPDVGSGS